MRLQRPALITAQGRDMRAMLVDLSQQGARIEAGSHITVGEQLRLEVDGLPVRFGQVRWQNEYSHGLEFQQAFRLEDFARCLFTLQPFAPVGLENDSQAAANFA
jgi:hypothetical protein